MTTRVLVVFGTRPEAIKLAPLILELERRDDIEVVVCTTAQHREMQDQVVRVFGIEPHHDLDLMTAQQTLDDIVAGVLTGMAPVIAEHEPDWVVVQGDTSTAFAAGLAAFHAEVPVAHVEAGLRTHRRSEPFPEEVNRRMVATFASAHFAPTQLSADALLAEGADPSEVHVTGNTVIDALHWALERDLGTLAPEVAALDPATPVIVVTGHRRENAGEAMRSICRGLRSVAESFPDHELVYPMHLSPRVREPVLELLGDTPNITLIEPQEYLDFIRLLDRSCFIISDSGGIQEEATALGKPVLVMRDVTERMEGVHAGVCTLVGTRSDAIFDQAKLLITDREAYVRASSARDVFGDGLASVRIADVLSGIAPSV